MHAPFDPIINLNTTFTWWPWLIENKQPKPFYIFGVYKIWNQNMHTLWANQRTLIHHVFFWNYNLCTSSTWVDKTILCHDQIKTETDLCNANKTQVDHSNKGSNIVTMLSRSEKWQNHYELGSILSWFTRSIYNKI